MSRCDVIRVENELRCGVTERRNSIHIKVKIGDSEIEYEGNESLAKECILELVRNFVKNQENYVMQSSGDESIIQSTDSESSSLIDNVLTTGEIAERIGVKTGVDLAFAAGGCLTLYKNKSSFNRHELHDEMKTARSFYKPSMSSNLSSILKRLKKRKFNSPQEGVYALKAEACKELETQLADR